MKQEQIKERSLLEQLIQLSHYTEDNTATPLILEYYTLERLGYKPAYIMGCMYAHYTPKSNKS